MGSNSSKEEKEVIITQAGNSGGISTNIQGKFSLVEICVFILVIFMVLVLGYFIWNYCKKRLEKKIRREVTRSQELMSITTQ